MTKTNANPQSNTDTMIDTMKHDLDQSTQAAAMSVIEETLNAAHLHFKEMSELLEKKVQETIKTETAKIESPAGLFNKSHNDEQKREIATNHIKKKNQSFKKAEEFGFNEAEKSPILNTNSLKESRINYLASQAKEQALQTNIDKLNHYRTTLKNELLELDNKKSALQQTIENSIHQLTTGNIDDINQQEQQQRNNQTDITTIEKHQQDIETRIKNTTSAKEILTTEKKICNGISDRLKDVYINNKYNEKTKTFEEQAILLIPMIEELNKIGSELKNTYKEKWQHYAIMKDLYERVKEKNPRIPEYALKLTNPLEHRSEHRKIAEKHRKHWDK